MSITQKDIPFLPGTVFQDPRKTDYRKAHVFDKSSVSIQINDEKAMYNPQGTTQNPYCTRGTVSMENSMRSSQTLTQSQAVNGAIDPSRLTTRGPIGCRTHLITEAPEGA